MRLKLLFILQAVDYFRWSNSGEVGGPLLLFFLSVEQYIYCVDKFCLHIVWNEPSWWNDTLPLQLGSIS